ncbi:hypothetical protein [Actinomadura sp. NTSP31]|uniref:WXG100 family type VII secretion target n=1 Tax=Actinomadura sp. NTSP31 TaxID=1735447 RepID=UPI0035C1E35D
MVTFAALRDARLDSVAEATEAWKALAARIDHSDTTVRELQQRVRMYWKGNDAEAANAQMQTLHEKTRGAYLAVSGISRVLEAAHQRLSSAQTALRQAIESAGELHIQVGDDGSLRFPPADGPTTVAEQTLMQQHGKAVQTRMRSALQSAADADRRITEALATLTPEVLEIGAAGLDPRQLAYRAVWMANPHDVEGRRSLADIMKLYQVEKDPQGMTEYPDGWLEWVAKRFGHDPQTVTMSEKEMLDDLFHKEGMKGLSEFQHDRSSATEGPPKWLPEGRFDGHGDAWRHAYWNALMTRDFGEEWTRKFAVSHERTSLHNPGPREAMDLYNNEVGRQIALRYPDATDEELAAHIREAVDGGRMVVVGPDGQLNWSDRVPRGHSMPEPSVNKLPEFGPGRPPSEVGR